MKKVNRRTFVTSSLGVAAALSIPSGVTGKTKDDYDNGNPAAEDAPSIIDTNVNLLDWPFRKLKYGKTADLVGKLRKHRITQAWAGSFEALLHKDINGVNVRLAEACKKDGDGLLLPFGTVNLAWPDWQEDLRRCHEVHHMPGIRIYPIYQTFGPDHADFAALVKQVTDYGMILQIVGDMEDSRHHHPIVEVRDVNMEPLIDIVKQVPKAKVQLLYWNHRVSGKLLDRFVKETRVQFDTSRVEGAGEVGRLIEGKPWYGNGISVPADRFVFGSHAPYFPVETSIIKLFEAPLTREQIASIMNGNARRFLPSV